MGRGEVHVSEEGRSFSFEGECAAAAHIGRTGMGEKEQARLIRGRTSQPATARVIHEDCILPVEASRGECERVSGGTGHDWRQQETCVCVCV